MNEEKAASFRDAHSGEDEGNDGERLELNRRCEGAAATATTTVESQRNLTWSCSNHLQQLVLVDPTSTG